MKKIKMTVEGKTKADTTIKADGIQKTSDILKILLYALINAMKAAAGDNEDLLDYYKHAAIKEINAIK